MTPRCNCKVLQFYSSTVSSYGSEGYEIHNTGKGQLISKGLFSILNSPKNRTKKFDFTTMIPQVDLFSFVFLGEIEDTKKTFRN